MAVCVIGATARLDLLLDLGIGPSNEVPWEACCTWLGVGLDLLKSFMEIWELFCTDMSYTIRALKLSPL
jgi:hypothetical protein